MDVKYLYTILCISTISLTGFAGILTFPFKGGLLRNIIRFLVSFSAGALFGDAFLHLLPEAIKGSGLTFFVSLNLLSGIFFFFVLEKIIQWRHCHLETTESHPHPFATMNLIGDCFHNFIDGMVIAGSFCVSPLLGFTTTLAVFSHEIPQEIGDYCILIYGGYGKVKALLMTFTAQLTAFLGAFIILILNMKAEALTSFLVPFTAGGFIYIAGSDLVPEMHKEIGISSSLVQLIAMVLGVALMVGLLLIG